MNKLVYEDIPQPGDPWKYVLPIAVDDEHVTVTGDGDITDILCFWVIDNFGKYIPDHFFTAVQDMDDILVLDPDGNELDIIYYDCVIRQRGFQMVINYPGLEELDLDEYQNIFLYWKAQLIE